MTMQLRSYTAEGNTHYRACFKQIVGGYQSEFPASLVEADGLSVPVGRNIQIERRTFNNRWELGSYLVELLSDIPQDELAGDVGLWNWITAFYFDDVFPWKKSGSQEERFVLDLDNSQRWYRHLVRTSWDLVASHGDAARVVLTSKISQISDDFEQLVSRQDFLAGHSILEAAAALYLIEDGRGMRLARKARDKKGTPGALRRFVTVIQQLWCTFDIVGMPAEEILKLLPEEFASWRDRQEAP